MAQKYDVLDAPWKNDKASKDAIIQRIKKQP